MNKDLIKLGIAPIAWTNDDLPELGKNNTFEQCISEMALAGFTGSEVGNKYPKNVDVIKPMLEIRGLQICNAWFSTFFATKPEEETITEFIKMRDYLHALGAKVIGCSEQSYSIQGLKDISLMTNKPQLNEQEWQKVGEGYNKLAEIAQEKQMKVCLHPHVGTVVQTPDEIDKFISVVNENVYLLLDTGHLYYSEQTQQAVEEIFTKFIKKIIHVHLKDIRPNILQKVINNNLSFLDSVKEGVFTIPGDGIINFKPIFKILDDHKYSGWMVVEAEQDPAQANPFEYAKKAREFIRDCTGI